MSKSSWRNDSDVLYFHFFFFFWLAASYLPSQTRTRFTWFGLNFKFWIYFYTSWNFSMAKDILKVIYLPLTSSQKNSGTNFPFCITSTLWLIFLSPLPSIATRPDTPWKLKLNMFSVTLNPSLGRWPWAKVMFTP